MKILAATAFTLLAACASRPEASAPPVPSASAAATPPERTDRGWAKAATGCQDFTVIVTHASKRRFLVIRSSRKALGLEKVGDRKTIDVSAAVRALDLEVSVYDTPGGDQHYCNDAVPAEAPPKTDALSPASGTVTVTLTSLKEDHDYAIDITVSGVTLRNHGDLETVPDATYPNVHVGWLPG